MDSLPTDDYPTMRELTPLLMGLALAFSSPLLVRADEKELPPPSAEKIDFERDVRPLFAQRCVKCHGASKQVSGLALHRKGNALSGGDSGPAIVPGKSAQSRLIRYVAGLEGEKLMPPAKAGQRLTDREVGVLRAWIDQGANWPADGDPRTVSNHWAYKKPVRPRLPAVKDNTWLRNPIDYFILSRLEKEGLKPSPEADRVTLIRRVSLDLTGLPPTVREVEEFVEDARPDAYERLVERLLASPRYGERWARPWLDLARYADTNGYEKDKPRTIWLWRDWVIKALNDDMPFDRFSVEQIAGDLLPDATPWQMTATGFHRNSMLNDEGGITPEEFRVVAVKDRVDTTATVWLGTTLECAQCHSHKYDPFSQAEYYQFLAFFNQTADSGVGNGPEISVSTWAEEARLSAIEAEMQALEKKLKDDADRLTDAQKKELKDRIAGKVADMLNVKPPTTMVMQEVKERRPNHVMVRGDYKQKGRAVEPDTPSVLHPFPKDAPRNRLGLARWLVDRENPLTARVTVNRIWQTYWGNGLLTTPEDFGTQSERPTHPDLLDWLACEFIGEPAALAAGSPRAWSMKHLHRLIVTSAAYRQSSKLTPDLLKGDPYNLLYARGSRLRLEFEALRDVALAAGGRLSQKIGGPSVMPPQPPGVWENSFGFFDLPDFRWRDATGEDRYRRGLYTFLRRSAIYPTFKLFDAPSREVCSVKRPRTNTPLQALVTLNDPVFVEAAAGLARRMMADVRGDAKVRAAYGFRLCVGRAPEGEELDRLVTLHEKALAKYRANKKAADALVHYSRADDAGLWPHEMAAWIVVANVLLNLDETLTRG